MLIPGERASPFLLGITTFQLGISLTTSPPLALTCFSRATSAVTTICCGFHPRLARTWGARRLMTTAWSWSLMREPWWKSTTLAATPQVRREQGSTAWGRVRCCSVGTVRSWMHYPKSLSSSVGMVVTTAIIWARCNGHIKGKRSSVCTIKDGEQHFIQIESDRTRGSDF